MEQKDKALLLLDLCARFPYDVQCALDLDGYRNWNPDYDQLLTEASKARADLPAKIKDRAYTLYGLQGERATLLEFEDHGYGVPLEFIKPYLRPMSSMTEEEQLVFSSKCELTTDINGEKVWSVKVAGYDWLNAHYFDYRRTEDGKTMIEAGLALEAPEGMYDVKQI